MGRTIKGLFKKSANKTAGGQENPEQSSWGADEHTDGETILEYYMILTIHKE